MLEFALLSGLWLINNGVASERWVHPLAKPLEIDRNGPFVVLDDGSLGTVDEQGFRTSKDDGKTWSEAVPVCKGINPKEPASFYLLRTQNNTLVLVYLNFAEYRFEWDEERKEPKEGCKLEVWAIRSLDGGKTWVDNQRLLGGYNANFFGLIQTRTGRIVVPLEHLASDPGRIVVCSFYSDDEGKTWKRSNWIDLGGHGHHDGAMEPTVAELSNGRLLMLIRTSLDRFWQAISDDGGRYWRTVQPSPIDASNSPGYLLKLKSGRLVLVWNRLNPEGRVWQKSVLPQHTEFPSSWHREELSIAFSEDDGRTWTKPIVLARQPRGQLSYPYLFERRPGEIWVIAGFAFRKGWQEPLPLRLKVDEGEFIKEAKQKQM
jgi:Neuraminidase (sialidase)